MKINFIGNSIEVHYENSKVNNKFIYKLTKELQIKIPENNLIKISVNDLEYFYSLSKKYKINSEQGDELFL